jgi:hypothetical protein
MDGSVWPLYGPGLQAARMCCPAGQFYWLGPALADHKTSWAVPSEDVLEDESDVLY